VPSNLGLDSLVVGFYRGVDLVYAAHARAGFIPATRRLVFEKSKHLTTSRCPFVNLPEDAAGRWGQGLTAEKMKDIVAKARGRRSDRVFGMDRSQSLNAYKVHSTTRRQRPEKGSKGGLNGRLSFVLLGPVRGLQVHN
jgi:hypothetical protein